jgi:hypothetical protein
MGTFTPVFPNGRVGTLVRLMLFELFLSEALANGAIEAKIDPAPTAPTVFKKVRREFFVSFFVIGSPYL